MNRKPLYWRLKKNNRGTQSQTVFKICEGMWCSSFYVHDVKDFDVIVNKKYFLHSPIFFFFFHSAPHITWCFRWERCSAYTRAWLPQSQRGSLRLNCTHFMRFPCCSSMDPFEYIVYFGGLTGNQALVHHLDDSNTKVKSGLVCFFFFICGKLQ